MRKIVLINLLFFTSVVVYAQNDQLLLLSGRMIKCTLIDTSSNSYISYQLPKREKIYEEERNRVFSYTIENHPEQIVYKVDSLQGNDFTIHEMRMFMHGGSDARSFYKYPFAFVGGVIIGAASGFLLPYVLTPVAPGIFAVAMGAGFVKINRNKLYNKMYLSEETYIMGYEKAGKSKRIQNAIGGGLVGIVAGISARYVLEHIE